MKVIVEALDSAADNMKTWFITTTIAGIMCAIFVSPRVAAVYTLLFSVSRFFTPFGMMFLNPIPQTLNMSLFTGFTTTSMRWLFILIVFGDYIPLWIIPRFVTPEWALENI